MGTLNENVRTNVKQLRTDWHWSLRALSTEVSKAGGRLSASMICDIENAKRHITVDDLEALAAALKTEPLRLLTR